ncbi:hypothetical protein MKEN_01340600 [Mycena kentingensis (nom. inval.)]|nr:hypothetical protein MKEN_01340600 [Mycena kentingensis (nom. inval.)]
MFSVLNNDIWTLVMCFCDVFTVLQLGQVNSTFYGLSRCKTVWLALLGDLTSRGLVQYLARPRLMTSGVIIEHIKCTVKGPRPTRRNQTVQIHPPLQIDRLCAACGPVRLLPGGRYAVIVRPKRFDCVYIGQGRVKLVWSLHAIVHNFSVEMVRDGHSARFLFLLRKVADSNRIAHIRVKEVNFRTGTARKRCSIPSLPGLPVAQFTNLNLSSAFFSITFKRQNADTFVLLVNWRKGLSLLWNCERQTSILPTLLAISGHIILATTDRDLPCAPVLMQWNMKQFRGLWRPIGPQTLADTRLALSVYNPQTPPVYINDLHRTLLWDLRGELREESVIHMRIQPFRDPLRHAQARLLVHLSGDIVLAPDVCAHKVHFETPSPGEQKLGIAARVRRYIRGNRRSDESLNTGTTIAEREPTGLLLRYSISCYPEKFDVCATLAAPTYLPGKVQDLSYAGYGTRAEDGCLIALDPEIADDEVEDEQTCLWRHLSASGATATLVDPSTAVFST